MFDLSYSSNSNEQLNFWKQYQAQKETNEYYDIHKERLFMNCKFHNEDKDRATVTIYFDSTSKQPRVRREYKDGKLDGTERWYTPDGTLWLEREFKEGKLHGVSKQYSIKGELLLRETFRDGKRDGESRQYDHSGKLLSVYHYSNGKIEEPVYIANLHYYRGGYFDSKYESQVLKMIG